MGINIVRGVIPLLRYQKDKSSFLATMMYIGDLNQGILLVVDADKIIGITNDITTLLSSMLSIGDMNSKDAKGFILIHAIGDDIGNKTFDLVIDATAGGDLYDRDDWFEHIVSPRLNHESNLMTIAAL
jgi:hypothetical protein